MLSTKQLIIAAFLVVNVSASRLASSTSADLLRDRPASQDKKVVHGADKVNALLEVINERSQGSAFVNASQLYEDISWLVPCPVAGAMVKYVLHDLLLKDENTLGFVDARDLQKALMDGTGMSINFATFSAGGIAAYSKTDKHQEFRSTPRRLASLLFMRSSNFLLKLLGKESGLNLLTMNNDDKCPDPKAITPKKSWYKPWSWWKQTPVDDGNFNDREVEGQTMKFPCNGNVRHQQHGFSSNIRAVEADDGSSLEEMRASRTRRFESWLPKDGKILTQVPGNPDAWELTLGGFAAFMKKMQKDGMKDSEFSELRECGDCYKDVPTEDVSEPEGLGAKANPRLALTQWQPWLVWPGFFTYYALPWPEENASYWGEGRSISETDLKNVFLDSTYRNGFIDKIKSGQVSWGFKENIRVMHELGAYWGEGEDKPDFLKLVDKHLYPQIEAGVTEYEAFKAWMAFTRKSLFVMSGTCNDAASRGTCD